MSLSKKSIIEVQGTAIAVLNQNDQDYISLTDIARYRDSQEPFAIINNWMRSRSTIEFLGLWERLGNPNFKPLEFERFRNEAGNNYFVLSPQRWIEATNSIGITKKFKEILLDIQNKTMKEQEKYLDDYIENWKAGTEQIDDILVIGVRM